MLARSLSATSQSSKKSSGTKSSTDDSETTLSESLVSTEVCSLTLDSNANENGKGPNINQLAGGKREKRRPSPFCIFIAVGCVVLVGSLGVAGYFGYNKYFVNASRQEDVVAEPQSVGSEDAVLSADAAPRLGEADDVNHAQIDAVPSKLNKGLINNKEDLDIATKKHEVGRNVNKFQKKAKVKTAKKIKEAKKNRKVQDAAEVQSNVQEKKITAEARSDMKEKAIEKFDAEVNAADVQSDVKESEILKEMDASPKQTIADIQKAPKLSETASVSNSKTLLDAEHMDNEVSVVEDDDKDQTENENDSHMDVDFSQVKDANDALQGSLKNEQEDAVKVQTENDNKSGIDFSQNQDVKTVDESLKDKDISQDIDVTAIEALKSSVEIAQEDMRSQTENNKDSDVMNEGMIKDKDIKAIEALSNRVASQTNHLPKTQPMNAKMANTGEEHDDHYIESLAYEVYGPVQSKLKPNQKKKMAERELTEDIDNRVGESRKMLKKKVVNIKKTGKQSDGLGFKHPEFDSLYKSEIKRRKRRGPNEDERRNRLDDDEKSEFESWNLSSFLKYLERHREDDDDDEWPIADKSQDGQGPNILERLNNENKPFSEEIPDSLMGWTKESVRSRLRMKDDPDSFWKDPEQNYGHDVLEGDIRVSKKYLMVRKSRGLRRDDDAAAANEDYVDVVEEDMAHLGIGDKCTQKQTGTNINVNALKEDVESFSWERGLVRYAFATNYSSAERYTILDAMNNLADLVNSGSKDGKCISYTQYDPKRDDGKEYVWFYPGEGCESPVGAPHDDSNRHVSLASSCMERGVIQHELIHILGFWHEQSRIDRDKYVDIKWENIEDGICDNFKMYSDPVDDHLGLPYDLRSIMHYKSKAFSKNGMDTIVPKFGYNPNVLGQRMTPTAVDLMKVRLRYNCSERKPPKDYLKLLKFPAPDEYQNRAEADGGK